MICVRGRTESTVLVLTVRSIIAAGTFPEQEREKKGAIPRVCCFSLPQNHAAQHDVHGIEQQLSHAHTALRLCPLQANLGHLGRAL